MEVAEGIGDLQKTLYSWRALEVSDGRQGNQIPRIRFPYGNRVIRRTSNLCIYMRNRPLIRVRRRFDPVGESPSTKQFLQPMCWLMDGKAARNGSPARPRNVGYSDFRPTARYSPGDGKSSTRTWALAPRTSSSPKVPTSNVFRSYSTPLSESHVRCVFDRHRRAQFLIARKPVVRSASILRVYRPVQSHAAWERRRRRRLRR